MNTKLILGGALTLAALAGYYWHIREVRGLRAEIALLQQRNSRMSAQYGRERGEELRRVKDADDARTATQLLSPSAGEAGAEYRVKIDLLKGYLGQFPETNIPELSLLQPQDWLKVAADFPLDSEDNIRRALAALRLDAKKRLGPELAKALKEFVAANNQVMPNDAGELASYTNPALAPEILARYQIVTSGEIVGGGTPPILIERDRVDDTYDNTLKVSPNGSWGSVGYNRKPDAAEQEFVRQITAAGRRWQAAHPGQDHPADRAEAVPYMDPTVDQERLQNWVKTGRIRKE